MIATLYIGGEWIGVSSSVIFRVTDPATLDRVAECSDGGVSEAREAANAAAAAFPSWSHLSASKRSSYLQSLAALVEADAEHLAELIVRESGKPIRDARQEVSSSLEYLRWNAAQASRSHGRTIPVSQPDIRLSTIPQPAGVVLAITPWNYPLNTLMRKLAPALAAGCTLIVKPAPETPCCAVELFHHIEAAGLPPGVANLVTTSRAEALTAIWMEDERVRRIAFTGSTAVARLLARQAAATLKKVQLEAGGIAPAVVFDDSDIEQAAASVVASRFRHAGQTCICVQRALVQRSVAAAFRENVLDRVRTLQVGNGRHNDTDLGPLIGPAAFGRVRQHVDDALSHGASLVVGGSRRVLPPPNQGFFFDPTVIEGVHAPMKIATEETFGPVLGISTFHTEEEAIREANSTIYGLAAYIFTTDLHRAARVVEALEFGSVGVNDTRIVAVEMPFGGIKQSGIGKENGEEGFGEYLDTKSIATYVR